MSNLLTYKKELHVSSVLNQKHKIIVFFLSFNVDLAVEGEKERCAL